MRVRQLKEFFILYFKFRFGGLVGSYDEKWREDLMKNWQFRCELGRIVEMKESEQAIERLT